MITLTQGKINKQVKAWVNPVDRQTLIYSNDVYVNGDLRGSQTETDDTKLKLMELGDGEFLAIRLSSGGTVFHVFCPANQFLIENGADYTEYSENAKRLLPILANGLRNAFDSAIRNGLDTITVPANFGAQHFCNMPIEMVVKTVVTTVYNYCNEKRDRGFHVILSTPSDYDLVLKLSRRYLEMLSSIN